MPTASGGVGEVVAVAPRVAKGRRVRYEVRGAGGGRSAGGSGENAAGGKLERVIPPSEPGAVASAARVQRCGVRQQRGEDAPGAAPQPQSGDARPQAAVLQLSSLPRRQTQEALPLRTVGPETAQLRPLGLAPDGSGRTGATCVKFWTCGLRRSRQSGRARLIVALRQRPSAIAPLFRPATCFGTAGRAWHTPPYPSSLPG